jgi:hypothetical protein
MFMIFSTYPFLNLHVRTHLLNIFFQRKAVNRVHLVFLNIFVTLIPLTLALTYPYIGTIMAFVGAFGGFFAVYLLPIMVHLKRRYTQITNPLLAEAISLNEFTVITDLSPKTARLAVSSSQELSKSPKIVISDRIVGRDSPTFNNSNDVPQIEEVEARGSRLEAIQKSYESEKEKDLRSSGV